MTTIRSALKLFPFLLLASCANTQEPAPSAIAASEPEAALAVLGEATDPDSQPDIEAEAIEYGNFTEDQLYRAILAEIGGQRGRMEEAGENYLELALSTRDLSVIRRAVQFASANDDTPALLELGLLWTQVAPQDPQPHLMLSFEFLNTGNYGQALSHMARVIDLGADVDFTALAARTGNLQRDQRSRLIGSLRQLRSEFSEEPSIHLTLIQLLAQNGEYEEALLQLRELTSDAELSPMLVRLEAQILQSNGDIDAAIRVLRDGVEEFPDARSIRLSFARMLAQQENFVAARNQFRALVEQNPEDWETWYSLALLNLELESFENAIEIFERLISAGQSVDQSQYYLGFIYEQMEQPAAAIEHYRQVRIGSNNYLAAQQQATRLSIDLGELAEAHAWLISQSRGQPRLEVLFTTVESNLLIQAGYSDAAGELLNTSLNKYPNDADLLFSRVLLNDSLANQEASERDLRQIIRMQPDNAQALNHLGYMLADQTDRYEESLELVEQAIALAPDDPAIIDSLGWAQYKLGRYEEALRSLRRAFAAFPNHEVASHLGEVLWQLDRRDEALEIWQQGLEDDPDSEIIQEAMDRLRDER